MKPLHSSMRVLSCLRHSFTLLATLAGAALLIGISTSRISADPSGLPPTIHFTQGILGTQVCLQWDAQPGVQYIVQKSATLVVQGSPGGFKTVALVTAEGAACQWVDPEAATTRSFYRIEIPGPKVFALEPAVISPTGGDIFVRGQLLPAGSFLALEIPGQAPIFVPLEPVVGQPGLWRASVGGIAGGVIAGIVVAARVVDSTGATVALVDQTIEVTETGYASDAPPWLPPAAPVPDAASNPIPGVGIVVKRNKPGTSGHRATPGPDDDCDDLDDDFASGQWLSKKGYDYYKARSDLNAAGMHTNPYYVGSNMEREMPGGSSPSFSLLMPALMKAKEKANRTKCANNLRQISFASTLTGEVAAEQCDLALAAPAGPPLEWVRTYRSKAPVSSGHGSGWDFSYNIYIEPIPQAAGVSAPVVVVHDGAGRSDRFERQTDGTYRCNGMFREGRFNPDTSFTLTFADKGTWVFCPLVGVPGSGCIGSITDRNGVSLSFAYKNDQLATVSDAFGRSLAVTWEPTGQISSVTDSTGRSVSYSYYGGEPGGSAGDLKSISCPQEGGLPPVSGPTTFTYTSGFADDRLNHNLTGATDGADRNLCAFTYSVSANPAELEFDTVASVRKGHELTGNVTLIKIGPAPQPPGGFDPSAAYVVYENDELGRVTETTCDRMHRPTSVREYTGFATPGVPVTATTNRPTGKLRASDPDFFQTTCIYNGQHLCTRITWPDGLQERTTYEYDLNPAGPLRERANPRISTLVSPGGEQRTVSMEYLPGFGSTESECYGAGLPKITPKIAKESHGKFRLPLLNYASIECASIKIEIGAAGHKSAEDLAIRILQDGNCEEGEFQDYVAGGGHAQGVMGQKAKAWMVNNFMDGGGGGGGTYSARGVDRDGKDCTNHGRPKLGAARVGPKQKQWLCSNFRISLRTSLGQQFTWGYDAAGNCTSSRTPIAGAGCDIAYNPLGQVTSVTTLNGPGSSFTDECVYDAATHFCTSFVSDSAGLHLATSCTRDALGRVTSITDPRGFDTLFTYNPLDQCVTVQSPPVGTTAAARITTTCFYDAGGLLSGFDMEHRDATGALVAANPAYSTRYIRESPSRPRFVSRVAVENRPVTLPPGSTDISSVGLENFDVSDFLFDAAGQMIQESTPAVCRAQSTDSVTSYQYDERGLLYRCIDGLSGIPGAVTTTTECDYTPVGDLSRCATLADSGGLPGAVNPTVTFSYDGFRRCISSTDPMGNVEMFVYDNQGNVTCSLYGELEDVPGSAGNILLSTCKLRVWQLMQGQRGRTEWITSIGLPKITPKIAKESHGRFRPAFFDVFVEDDTMTVDRFTPGAATPTAQEVTTVNRSPAGFVMNVSTNGDTLVTNTYDTAGRLITCANGACSVAYTLDACGNVLACARTDFPSGGGNPAVNLIRAATYDAIGRAMLVADGTNTTTYEYDSLGRIVRCAPPIGAPVVYDYDGGTAAAPYSVRMRGDVDGDGSPETLGSAYARSCPKRYKIKIDIRPPRPPIFGRSVTNSNGHTTTFTLDSQDRCVRTDFPDGTFETNTFNSLGHLIAHTRKNGAIIAADFDYKERARLVTCTDPNPGVVPVPPTSYLYSGLDDCTRMTQGTSDMIRAFDSCGNLVSESQNGHVVQHTYTHRGRASTTYPSGARFNEVRNAQGLLVSVSAEGAAATPISSIQYLGHRPAQETRHNGVVTTFVYRGINDPPLQGTGPDFSIDACVQCLVTGPTGTVLSRSFFSRDANQQLIRSETLFGAGPNNIAPLRRRLITRDRLGRLTRMITGARPTEGTAITPESDVTYTLDLEGRRLTATGGVHPGAYTSSDLIPPGDLQMSQYSSWPGGALAWDDNGNLTLLSDGAVSSRQFVYDACSRLVAVVDPNTGSAVASYSYDARDRLISSTVADSNAGLPPVSTFFIYDGDTCIQELNELGQPQLTFAAMGLCIVPINGDPIYPHGSSNFLTRSIKQGHYAVSNFHIEVDGASGGYLSSLQAPSYEVEDVSQCLTSGTGAVLEHFAFDDGGQPIFLTSEGVVRPGASSSLSGYRWMAPECIWSPESGLFHYPGGAYSPALGQGVATATMEFMVEDFRYKVDHK